MPLCMNVGLGPGHIVLHGESASIPNGAPPIFYCSQTAGWIKMSLYTEIGLGPGHIVLDGTQLPRQKGPQPPDFRPMYVVTKRLDGSRCHLWEGRPQSRPLCAIWDPAPPKKGHNPPNFWPISIVAKRSPKHF